LRRATERVAQLGVCFAAYRNRKHPVTVRVTHVRGVLTIALDVVDDGRFATPCIATVAGDARVVLARNSYVGLSASTGLYPDSHVVYALTLSATPPAGTGGGAAPDDSDGGSGAGADVDAAQPDLSTRHHHHEPHHPPATADARARPPPSPSATHADTHADGETSEKGERQHALSGVASVFGAHAGGHAQSLRPADAAKAHVPTAAHGGASAAASAHAPLSGADAGLSADVHSTQAWVHAIERALAAEHELNARRHAEAMDAIRAIGQRAGADAAGPLTNGAHDGRGRAPPLLGGGAGPELSRSVERILALVEGLAAASGTGGAPGADAAAQIASTLDERLAAISAALSQTVDAAKHGAGAEQTRQSLDSMQRLVEASVDKLHAMQAQQERAESAHVRAETRDARARRAGPSASPVHVPVPCARSLPESGPEPRSDRSTRRAPAPGRPRGDRAFAHPSLLAQTSLLSSLKGHLSELGSSHTELHGAVSKSLGAAAGSGGGAWMSLGSFVVFQALFTAVFLFYKRYVDSNKDKLF
jgi:hypothetical protein